MTLCHNTRGWRGIILPPYTSNSSIGSTAARLQLALDNGLTIEQLTATSNMPRTIVECSLEPMKVLTLARLYGLLWSDLLTEYAAIARKYELLKWLIKCGCPFDIHNIINDVMGTSDVEHKKQLRAITGPWPADRLKDMLLMAGSQDDFEIVKWCREQGTAWPTSFYEIDEDLPYTEYWSLRCVQWALANGSTWRTWRCQDVVPEYYERHSDGAEHSDDTCTYKPCHRKHAAELFKWAHQHGCPCTCGEA
jgi:hypothetical protein